MVQSSNPNPLRNVVEAEMCRNLANYLVMQGQYRASEVSNEEEEGGAFKGSDCENGSETHFHLIN